MYGDRIRTKEEGEKALAELQERWKNGHQKGCPCIDRPYRTGCPALRQKAMKAGFWKELQ